MASRLNPHISFTDNARQALEFYREVFGGELRMNTFGGPRVELVDGRALTWYGPRIPAALAAYRELLEEAA